MNSGLTTTKKGVTIILIFYAVGITVAIYGLAVFHNLIIGIGIVLLLIGVILAVLSSIRPVGWLGMTKEKTS